MGVYSIAYSHGKIYIVEIGYSLKVYLKEHPTDISYDQAHKSALAEHAHNISYHICLEDSTSIAKEEYYTKIRMKEA